MACFDEYISAGVHDGILPGAILYAIDKSGMAISDGIGSRSVAIERDPVTYTAG